MMTAIPIRTDRKRAAGWLDGSVNFSPAASLGEKGKERLKSWVAQLMETHVKCCVLCIVSLNQHCSPSLVKR